MSEFIEVLDNLLCGWPYIDTCTGLVV